MQAERIDLLDQLEQFPLKIRVKEDQDKILRCTLMTTHVMQISCLFSFLTVLRCSLMALQLNLSHMQDCTYR